MSPKRVKLLEPFKDFGIELRGRGYHSKYEQLFKVVPKPSRPAITLQDLQEYVEELRVRYPERCFTLRHEVIDGHEYWVLTQEGVRKKKDAISIYFDLADQRIAIPIFFWKNRKRLARFILHRVMGRFGWIETKYARQLGRG
jgi:hypothetical protein